jgi:CheY-like chemotaxis protein
MTPRILVVEDEPDIRDELVFLLSSRGYDVSSAANGQLALSWMETNGPPTLLVLDLMMPVMDGRAVVQRMAADPHLISVPVVVLTAQHRLASGLSSYAEAVLFKPIPLPVLLTRVDTICKGQHTATKAAARQLASS